MNAEEDASVTVFRNYLRINSMQPTPDYAAIVKFLCDYAKEAGFNCRVYEAAANRPIVIITVVGTKPDLPSVLLNSHTDVVPVFPECWKFDPFSATKTENGDIYARGSQDMKCVGIQHLEAVKQLKAEGKQFERTVHLSFVPDEEIGGELGMKAWVDTNDFKSLNVGFALDEGLANEGEEMRVFYSERMAWWGFFTATGNPGHGSQFLTGTAGPKIEKILHKIHAFRDEQEAILRDNSSLTIGDVSTINVTKLHGGVQSNVVPAELKVTFDLRISPRVTIAEMDAILASWESDCDVKLGWDHKQEEKGLTDVSASNPWWMAFTQALQSCGVKHTTEVFPAGTDSRYLRNIGLPAIGFSPMNRTPILLHDHNEFLNEKIFLRGIEIFKTIIPAITQSF